MEKKRILVTGGAGFVDSNPANYLSRDNELIAVDDLYLGTPENLHEDAEFVDASVLDDHLPTGVNVACHLAALSFHAMQEADPPEGARVSVEVFVNTGYEPSKLARERYVKYFANNYGLSMARTRFFGD